MEKIEFLCEDSEEDSFSEEPESYKNTKELLYKTIGDIKDYCNKMGIPIFNDEKCTEIFVSNFLIV